MTVQTEHFDIYYDRSKKSLVPRVAHYLERAWKEVGDSLGYKVRERSPFFIYANHNEFEQTNIVSIGEGTGGVTEPFKNRFLVFNDGSETWLKHVIYHEFAHIVEFNILYGGFWKTARLLKFPFYPLWMMEGLAEYAAGDVDAPTGDMVIRDAVANKEMLSLAELHGFNHLKPNQVTLAYKTGEAAITFLKDEYGEEKVHKLLVLMKDHFDISAVLEELIGSDILLFDFRFNEWLENKYASFLASAKAPLHYGPQLTFSDGIPQANRSPVVSPDGQKIYFFSDKAGLSQLYEYDVKTQERRALIKLDWTHFENLHTRGRGLSVSPDGRWLAFAGEKKQRDFLYLYDLKRKRLKKVKTPFHELRSPAFSPSGDHLVCVGMTHGFNDLYLINRRGDVLDRLTDSPQDEQDPAFSPDGTRVVFSGEVLTEEGQDPAGRDLFEVQLNGRSFKRLTNLNGYAIEPEVLPDGSIVFVRDRNDAGQYGFNLYHLPASTNSAVQLTNFVGGGFSPRYAKTPNTFYYLGFHSGEYHIFKGTWTVSPETVKLEDKAAGTELAAGYFNEEGDPPLDPKAKRASRPVLQWPEDSSGPFLLGRAKPYRFQASTDIFLPVFLYSSFDGLSLANIWRFSELLGNHQLEQQMQYASKTDFIDLTVLYTYARFRPQLTLGFSKEKFYRDFARQRQRKETSGVGFVTYPLDRISSVSLGAGATDREDFFFDNSEPNSLSYDRFWSVGFLYDTITGRYLVPTRGRAFNLLYQQGHNVFNGNQKYKSGVGEVVQYVPISVPRESTFVSRLLYGRSVGRNPQSFRLGGVDRIRGLSSRGTNNEKNNIVITSAELRLKLRYLNWRTKFLFPDFFFKAAYLIVFDDIGYGWNTEAERDAFKLRSTPNSAGVGLSWPTFILQTFKLDLTVLWARRTDLGDDIWYVTVGPQF